MHRDEGLAQAGQAGGGRMTVPRTVPGTPTVTCIPSLPEVLLAPALDSHVDG